MALNRYIILFIGLFAGINLFFSCANTDDNDHTPPTIEVLSPVANATLNVSSDTDTGNLLHIFSGKFSDDTALSSYTFRIQHERDTVNAMANDSTAYFYKNYQGVAIFDSTQVTVNQTFKIDSLMNITTKNMAKSYPIYEGLYYLRASVVDLQGNETHADSIPINIKYRTKVKKK